MQVSASNMYSMANHILVKKRNRYFHLEKALVELKLRKMMSEVI